ncbi:origin recognition complex subunit 1 Orc1 [Acidilobus saccharovorans 345-15]|uniref:ORC1-type DNA replication protein n=1 Tax=Acidilobus saccharovorans (strain DSM 16705 / JCM 18335 / VKM B-2471 / 345-15) TaxID=666510 RepID=D9Q1G7_ACIS3|nr:origin recognition complex subunit 1 Orc1 [Acidilobus saccharovorans 345-15]
MFPLDEIDNIFEAAARSRVFKNREVLLPDYVPLELPHREAEIKRLAEVVAPALRGERPSNAFIYGLTGTGKTAVTKYVLRRLEELAKARGSSVSWIYVNVRQRETPYKVLADMGEQLGLRVPFTGLSIGELFSRIVKRLSKLEGVYIVVLDEIDFLVRKGDDVLYDLTRINEHLPRAKVSLIGITNSVKLVDSLDPRVKSSLGEEQLVFSPYNAEQLKDILSRRASMAFNEGALEEGVIPLVAALAAREHGDARRALDMLRVAGEIAEREGADRVSEDHVYRARQEIERDKASDVIRTLPLHSKLILAAILKASLTSPEGRATTGEIYDAYRQLASSLGLEEVTLRRVSGVLGELDMLGIISSRVISRGRYGKTRVVELAVSPDTVIGSLSEDPTVGSMVQSMSTKGLTGKRGRATS